MSELNVVKSMALQKGLVATALIEGQDWALDNGEHLPYKGVFYRATKGDAEEEQSTLSILLSDGDPANRGQAIENRSNILKGLDNNMQPVTRLFVDRSKLSSAAPVLAKLGISTGAPV